MQVLLEFYELKMAVSLLKVFYFGMFDIHLSHSNTIHLYVPHEGITFHQS